MYLGIKAGLKVMAFIFQYKRWISTSKYPYHPVYFTELLQQKPSLHSNANRKLIPAPGFHTEPIVFILKPAETAWDALQSKA